MTMMPGLSDDDGKMLIADTLRAFVGLGRRTSWADLAEATGDDERKLRSYVDKVPAAMPGTVMMRVFAALPPEAWARVNRRMGFTAPGRLDVDDGATLRRAMSAASRLVANGTEALEDGVITPTERANIADQAEQLLPILTAVIINRN